MKINYFPASPGLVRVLYESPKCAFLPLDPFNRESRTKDTYPLPSSTAFSSLPNSQVDKYLARKPRGRGLKSEIKPSLPSRSSVVTKPSRPKSFTFSLLLSLSL